MIPLRILHALSATRGHDADAALALAQALREQQHESAFLIPTGSQPLPGWECLSWTASTWRWWRGGGKATARAAAAWTPDIIHVHDLGCLPRSLEVARRLALGLVASILGPLDQLPARRLADPRIAWVLVPAEAHRAEAIRRLRLGRDRVAVLPCGVRCDHACPPPLGNLLRVGALAPDQAGLALLLPVLKGLHDQGLPLCFNLWCDPRMAPRQRQQLAAKLVDAGCEAGLAPEEQPLSAFLASIAILVHPSPHAPHPWPLLNAMAMGRGLITTATGSATELACGGRSALLVEAQDATGLAQALRELAHPSRLNALASAGRIMAETRYSLPLVAEAAAGFYRDAIGPGGAGTRTEVGTVFRRMTKKRLGSLGSSSDQANLERTGHP